ncbi:uncharacterized protein LOC122984085 [Thunnus albacares]|uniref:uncharacterized protein LOC122984085 n=1 Tax=Thunnus albacares TaxID=8236 RepID=UPI001CF63013|nr:uncharacterized protein LOC122984085 [Thunnus albacares]
MWLLYSSNTTYILHDFLCARSLPLLAQKTLLSSPLLDWGRLALDLFLALEQQMQLAAAVNNLAARMGTETPVPEMPQNVSVSLATMSEVEELEEWLKDPRHAHAKQNMISALGAVGGENTKRVTWNILSRIFSDTVAKKINWKGVNGKKCFKEMGTRSLLIRAVRKNEAASSAPDSEIDSYAIRWFNLVSDRGGGRNDRAKVKEALTTASQHSTEQQWLT